MSKLVVFDWGGIIEKFEDGNYTVKDANILLLKHMGCDFEYTPKKYAVYEFVSEIRKAFIYDDDSVLEKWYYAFCHKFNSKLNFFEFVKLYKKYYEKNETNKDMIDLIYETKEYSEIALLSNLIKYDYDRLQKQIDLDKFDYKFLSFELGMKKPDEEIYKYLEQSTSRKPSEILFVDDAMKNIVPALNRGWNTVCESGANSKKIRKKILEFTKEI